MLRPARMRKFYVAVPLDFEEAVAEELGNFGFAELFSERQQMMRGEDILELYATFLRIYDRVKVTYETIEDIMPKVEDKKPFMDRIKGAFRVPSIKRSSEKISVDDLKERLPKFEVLLNKYSGRLDSIKRRLGEIDDLLLKVDVFRKNNISLDVVGDYTHIFVKAGFIPEANIDRLEDALKPFNVIITIMEGRPKEKFVIIAGSQKDKENIVNILTMLNMEEVVLPAGFEADPNKAYGSLMSEKRALLKELEDLGESVRSFLDELNLSVRYVRFMYSVRSMALRTRNFSVFYGWVPNDKIDELRTRIDAITKGLMHMEIVEPNPENGVKPPTYLRHPPILDRFQLIIRMRGLPSYYELDPTIFFTILFSIMYGMMFGDVGQGVVLFILGLILYRVKKSFLGISYSALNKLGVILSVASVFSMIFGLLYGESFLVHFMEPIWLNPLKDPVAISVVAILFGLVQLSIGIVLNIVNYLLEKDYISALLSWNGITGFIYYVIGVLLAVRFVLGGMKLDVFGYPENIPFAVVELVLLFVAFLKPTIENIVHGGHHGFTETLMEGISEFIEMFLSYITNSISYVRLGAFAIAHVALAEVAFILAEPMGFFASYFIFNVIVIIIEGFSAGIQSIRLLFYEFSTKFYRDEGRIFRPLRL